MQTIRPAQVKQVVQECLDTIAREDFDRTKLWHGDQVKLEGLKKWHDPNKLSAKQLNNLGAIKTRVYEGANIQQQTPVTEDNFETRTKKLLADDSNHQVPSTKRIRDEPPSDLRDKWLLFGYAHRDKRLTRAHLAVLWYVIDRYQLRKTFSLIYIAKEMWLSKKTVAEALNDLEGWGYLKRVRSTGGSNKRTRYLEVVELTRQLVDTQYEQHERAQEILKDEQQMERLRRRYPGI